MKKVMACLLFFLLFSQLIPVVNPGVTSTTSTWYVSPTGNDSNSGDIMHPFKTLRKAINASGTGDIIYLRGGNYNTIYPKTQGININRSGTPSSWFTISGFPGERAILNGNGYMISSGYGLLCIGRASQHYSYVRITNLVIENVSGYSQCHAIMGDYGSHAQGVNHHIRIDNVTINKCQYGAIKFWSINPNVIWTNNITIENCTINNTQYQARSKGESVTLFGCKNIVVKHNLWSVCPKTMIDIANNSKNGIVFNNVFRSTGTTKSTHSIYLDGSQSNTIAYNSNISIYNNLVIGTNDSAICVGAEYPGGCNNISIYNNIINISSASSRIGIRLQQSKGKTQMFSNITIKHNTINMVNAGYPLEIANYRTKMKNICVANNIFQSNNTAKYQVYSSVANSTDPCFHFSHNIYDHTTKTPNTAWKDGTGMFEATVIKASPQFVNRKAGNFHLNASSPAIDAADPIYAISTDYDGRPRPQNMSCDIGAYEYSTGTPPFQPSINDVVISPDLQQMGGNVNISCIITGTVENGDDVRVNITYPDKMTQNISMNPGYYLNQKYTQIGTYQFFIWVRDINGTSAVSSGHMFQIIPVLTKTFLLGLITDTTDVNGSIIRFNARFILSIGFNPFSIKIFTSYEKIYVSKNFTGYFGTTAILGMFHAAVFSEKTANHQLNHRILNRLHPESR